jgi:ribosomal RNA-processing protein 8
LAFSRPEDAVIADFGCGEGALALAVPQKVHSFDLVSSAKHVVACDMKSTPLEPKSVDVVVFCLSLMGTNLNDFIIEANRVLKPK